MRYVALDTETHLIAPGLVAPPLVVLSWATEDGAYGLVSRDNAREVATALLWDPDVTIVGHNIAFDLAVLVEWGVDIALVFAAYDAGRIYDTGVMDKLRAIRSGTIDYWQFHLSDLSLRHLGRPMAKGEDTWRTRYRELEDRAIEFWPKEAVDYAQGDAIATLGVFLAMRRTDPDYPHHDEIVRQTRAAWALHLARGWGIKADPKAVGELAQRTEAEVAQHSAALLAAGLIRIEYKGPRKGPKVPVGEVKNTKAIQDRIVELARRDGREVTRTSPSTRYPDGQVSTAKDVLTATGDETLTKLVERNAAQKILDFVAVLRKATNTPFNPRWNTLKGTGRSSCGSDEDPGNLQNQPRKGGVRECFVPDRGNAFVTCDYDCAELRGLAEVTYTWFGMSRMREVFLRGEGYDDPHLELHRAFPDIVPDRQFAKIPNFGFPGGLGAATFVDYAWANAKVRVDLDRAKALKQAWTEQWPETRYYLARISEIVGDFGPHEVTQLYSGRIRGNIGYTQAANTMFQGIVADGALSAAYQVVRECYAEPDSPLYGARMVAFIHDEIILECALDKIDQVQRRLAQVMIERMRDFLRHVPVRASGAAMPRWYKGAKPRFDADGKLVLWTPGVSPVPVFKANGKPILFDEKGKEI